MSFLNSASKRVTDVRGFLREAAGGRSIRYVAEKGKKHLLYIPYVEVNEVNDEGEEVTKKQLIAISGDIHDWTTPDGKYKATMCLQDVVREAEETGTLLNDGSCPICDRVSDAWDIYNYRKELEDAQCKLTGEDKKKHMEGAVRTFIDERKAREPRTYMYVLVVQYRYEDDRVTVGDDKLPEFDLKVMKLSATRVEKMQQQLANAGAAFAGSEIIIEYPATDDRRLQVSQSTTSPVFPDNMQVRAYPKLAEKITKEINKFKWDGIEKAFLEWQGMTTAEAKNVTDELFEQWDKYKEELKVNPSVKYLEYITDAPVSQPSLGDTGSAPSIPTAADAGQGTQGAPSEKPEIPPAPSIPDVNQVFGGGGNQQGGTIEI